MRPSAIGLALFKIKEDVVVLACDIGRHIELPDFIMRGHVVLSACDLQKIDGLFQPAAFRLAALEIHEANIVARIEIACLRHRHRVGRHREY